MSFRLFLNSKGPQFGASFFIGLVSCFALSSCKQEPDDQELNFDRADLAGSKTSQSCEKDSDCDDALYCNGVEECQNQVCVSGRPIVCDDAVECTVDSCDEAAEQCSHEAPDADFDGFKDKGCVSDAGEPLGNDCDDSDPLTFPGNIEVCDQENRDEDCDPTTIGQLDDDRDGYNSALCCNAQQDGELLCGRDCDDKKTNVNPEATEACDQLDNNCNGETDEGVSINGFADTDHDGRGDPEQAMASCPGTVGFVTVAGDCNDSDPEVFEGQFEICDEKDNNCDGQVDEVSESAPWFADVDQDGYGDANSRPIFSCQRVQGRVLSQNDCNDQNNLVNPNAAEVCDAIDNDCDGKANFKLSGSNNFEDDDEDGVADIDCGGDDCNDEDARTAAGAEEVCDRVDNDCDGEVDEQTVQNIWYIDQDGDGWGVVLGNAVASCDPVPGRATQFGDCDDTDQSIKPGVVELCDGIDQDCDGQVDEGAASFCDLDNAIATCTLGNCQIFTCAAGFEDADKNSENGCEAIVDPADLITNDTCSSDADCNDFDYCTGTETCEAGLCRKGTPVNCQGLSTVLEGGFELKNGQDLLALQGIEIITGDLAITESLLTSLVGLESLKVVGGNLFITQNNSLVRLSGSALSNLESVGGTIFISENESLTNIDLPSLRSASGLILGDNDSLKKIEGYENLLELDLGIFIGNSPSLESIVGFSQLHRLGGSASPSGTLCELIDPITNKFLGGFYLSSASGLEKVEAFQSLEEVAGEVCVRDLTSLETLSFPQLREIGANLELQASRLSALSLPQLGRVAGQISILEIASVAETGFQALSFPLLTEVDTLSIQGVYPRLELISAPQLSEVDALWLETELEPPSRLELQFDQLREARFIELAYSAPAGLPAPFFPLLEEVKCGLRLAPWKNTATGPTGSVQFPLLSKLGRGSDCSTVDIVSIFTSTPLPSRGFSLSVPMASDAVLSLPQIQDAAAIEVILEDGYQSSSAPFSLLEVSTGLAAGEIPALDALRIDAVISQVQIERVQAIQNELLLCLGQFDICDEYERISTFSGSQSTFFDESLSICPEKCDDSGGPVTSCSIDADCDDGIFCNGTEVCQSAVCQSGEAIDCDDGITCTTDSCSEVDELCVWEPIDDDKDGFADINCLDGSGTSLGTDCNDSSAAINPSATEVCDGFDNDCNGETDEELRALAYIDGDNDSYGEESGFSDFRCLDEIDQGLGWASVQGDCDDFNGAINPGATEVCDGLQIDEDCNPSTLGEDFDGDGYISDACCNFQLDGELLCGADCADGEQFINPGATEVCDGVDNDCNGGIDEGETVTAFFDNDKDGYGDQFGSSIEVCSGDIVAGGDYSLSSDDCNDSIAAINPGAAEYCDASDVDEDCNPATIGSEDFDADDSISDRCCNFQPDSSLLCGADCDDNKANVNPQQDEVCDHLDNNCNGTVDEGVTENGYFDNDHDGVGNNGGSVMSGCPGDRGFSLISGDCNDNDPEIFTGNFELCDSKDNDCDDEVDEVRDWAPWFTDFDQDGYGDAESTPIFSCTAIPGRVLSSNDCNDADELLNPGEIESCDGIDNNCDGKANFIVSGINNFEDDDGDLIPDINCGGIDCDDQNSSVAPNLLERCDLIDNNCNGTIDESGASNEFYLDDDGDGYGRIEATFLSACFPEAMLVALSGDCDDADPSIRPGMLELCDGKDQNCNGEIDENASSTCELHHAVSACSQGSCQVYTCAPGFADGDGDSGTGCEQVVNEAGLLTSTPCENDGECDDEQFCTGRETCQAGFCRLGRPIFCDNFPDTIWPSDFIVSGPGDITALQDIELISGDLLIENTDLPSLDGLTSLQSIGGGLTIEGNMTLTDLGLSNLETVAGPILISNNAALTTASLPKLFAAKSLSITNSDSLSQLDVPALAQVEGSIVIEQGDPVSASALEKISFPAMISMKRLYVLGTYSKLMRVEADLLEDVKIMRIAPQATGSEDTMLNFPSLIYADYLDFSYDGSAKLAIELPQLNTVGCALSVSTQAELSGASQGPVTGLLVPEVQNIGGGNACGPDTDPEQANLLLPSLPIEGFFLNALMTPAAEVRLPKLQNIARFEVLPANGLPVDQSGFAVLEVSTLLSLPIAVDVFKVHREITNVQLGLLQIVPQTLLLCITGGTGATGGNACPEYADFLIASQPFSGFVDESPTICDGLCQ